MNKTILRSPAFTIALFVVAAALLLVGTIGAVRAVPRTESNEYGAQVQMSDVHTAISENGGAVSGDALLGDMLSRAGDTTLKIGKEYDEVLAVTNTGSTDEYVRVTVLRYWTDGNGKAVDLDPSLIKLNFVEGAWSIDAAASTPERTVLYYSSVLGAGGTTSAFVDKLTIDNAVVSSVTTLADGTNEFDYENVQFHVQVTADAVQTHNAEAAMTSAWGRTN